MSAIAALVAAASLRISAPPALVELATLWGSPRGATVVSDGADVSLTSEIPPASAASCVPVAVSAIAVVYNLLVAGDLRVTRDALAAILAGRITRWSDPWVRAANPGVNIPDLPIRLVLPEGNLSLLRGYAGVDLNPGTPRTADAGRAVAAVEGSIGFLDAGRARRDGLFLAALQNRDGAFVVPTAHSVSRAAVGVKLPGDLRASLLGARGVDSYPMASLIYACARTFARGVRVPSLDAARRPEAGPPRGIRAAARLHGAARRAAGALSVTLLKKGAPRWRLLHDAIASNRGGPAVGGRPEWGFVKLGHVVADRAALRFRARRRRMHRRGRSLPAWLAGPARGRLSQPVDIDVARIDPSRDASNQGARRTMKTVAFVSLYDAARSRMAAAFFEAFTKPTLVRAISGGIRPLLWTASDVIDVMAESGFDVSGQPRVLSEDDLKRASMIVTVGEAGWQPPPSVQHEHWDVPDPRGLPMPRLRELRDRLRRRVWRLVAREGWYKLQPGAAFPAREQRA